MSTRPCYSRERHSGPRKPAEMALLIVRKEASSDRFLQLLGGAESNLLACLDVDRFAGGGVAAHAGGTFANLQDAEADDADTLTLLQVLGDAHDHVVQNAFGLLLGQLLLFGDGRREMLERNGRRSSCFLRHIWPSSLLTLA